MKCELCHQGDAETVIWQKTGETQRELYVCSACAAKEKEKEKSKERASIPGLANVVFGVGSLPEWCKDAIMGMLRKCLKGTEPEPEAALPDEFSIEGHAEKTAGENVREPSCPACGITRHEFRNAARLGCPACYRAFSEDLDPEILEMHGFTEHRGKKPPPLREGEEGGK